VRCLTSFILSPPGHVQYGFVKEEKRKEDREKEESVLTFLLAR
jgi:hypothetical protein